MRTTQVINITIILLCLSTSLFSQTNIFGGYYIGLGTTQPKGLTKEVPTGESEDVLGFMVGEEGLGLKSGYFFEMGGTGYFGDGWNQKRIRLGFDLNVKAYYHSKSEYSFKPEDIEYTNIIKFKRLGYSGSGGLVLTVSPLKYFTIDFIGRIRTEFFALPEFEFISEFPLETYTEVYVSPEKYDFVLGVGYGVRLKYKKIMLSAEWNFLNPMLETYESISDGISIYDLPFKLEKKSFLDLSIGIYL